MVTTLPLGFNKKRRNLHPNRRRLHHPRHTEYALCLRLGLLKTEAAAIFLPLATLLEQIDTLETLQNVALRCDLAGTSKTAMLTHDFFSFSKKLFAHYIKFHPSAQVPILQRPFSMSSALLKRLIEEGFATHLIETEEFGLIYSQWTNQTDAPRTNRRNP